MGPMRSIPCIGPYGPRLFFYNRIQPISKEKHQGEQSKKHQVADECEEHS